MYMCVYWCLDLTIIESRVRIWSVKCIQDRVTLAAVCSKAVILLLFIFFFCFFFFCSNCLWWLNAMSLSTQTTKLLLYNTRFI